MTIRIHYVPCRLQQAGLNVHPSLPRKTVSRLVDLIDKEVKWCVNAPNLVLQEIFSAVHRFMDVGQRDAQQFLKDNRRLNFASRQPRSDSLWKALEDVVMI